MKKLIVYMVLPVFLLFVTYSVVSVSASAAPVVSAGEALAVGEVLDLLAEYDLIDLDQAGNYFTPSLYLRMLSNTFDTAHIDVSNAAPWLDKILDVNNELFWSSDGSVVQEHNGQNTPVSGAGDLWFTSANMGGGYIPYNYIAQDNGFMGGDNSAYSLMAVTNKSGCIFNQPFYVLPIVNSGTDLNYGSKIFRWEPVGNTLYVTQYDSYKLVSTSAATSVGDINGNYYDFGFRPTGGNGWFSKGIWRDDGSLNVYNVTSLWYSIGWLSSSTGKTVSASGGDVSYLIYTSDPKILPSDIPTDNYIYCPDPNDTSSAVVVSPSGEVSNLWDYITAGFVFTGTVEVTGNYEVSANLNIGGGLGVNHSGDVTINFNDDFNIWADDGKSTDFGNGVSLDGNAFNDGFQWLLTGVSAVPVVLQQFTFIPAPVLGIITSALVVMVFLGLWRTFKGG